MIWLINLTLAGLSAALAVYGFLRSKILTETEILMYLLGNVLLFFFTKYIMGVYKNLVLNKGIFGMDINKRGTPSGELKIPESCGVPCAVAFMMFLTISIPFFKYIGNSHMESLLTTAAFSVILCCFLVRSSNLGLHG
jgi:UDP-N-acetylglucosamine--dolichyl-phosphate N-acetylglucosaminephosphotransferase